MDNLELDIDFLINNPEVKAAAEKAKADIAGVGETAEQTAAKVAAGVSQLGGQQVRTSNEVLKSINFLKIAMQAYQNIAETATDPALIERYNRRIAETSAEITRLRGLGLGDLPGQAVRATSNFNGLQNSINQISRELPAFTYSAQTGFMAISNNIPILVDELGNLRRANAQLVASGQTAQPVWKQLIGGLFSWGTALSLGVTLLTVYGKEIFDWAKAMFKGKDAVDEVKKSIEYLNEAAESTDFKNAITSVSELKNEVRLAKDGLIDKKDVVDKYNTSIGNTAGQVKTLAEVEKKITEAGPAYIKMMLLKAAAHLALEEAAKKALEAEQASLKPDKDSANLLDRFLAGEGNDFSSEDERKVKERGKKRKAALVKKAQDEQTAFQDIANKFEKDAAVISKQMGFDFFGDAGTDSKKDEQGASKAQKAFEDIVDSRKDVLDKLAALDAEYSRKGFTKDEEEKAALKAKFDDFRKIIEEENTKIAAFNKNNKNKLSLIDVSRVKPIEEKAAADLSYRQETEKLKLSLNEQKQLYAGFEAFKTQIGAEAAAKRFKDDIDTNKTFLKVLEEEKQKFEGKANLSGAEQERKKLLEEAIKAESQLKKDTANKDFAEAFTAAKTHAQKLLDIEKDYQDKVTALGESASSDQLAILEKQRDEKMQAENAAAIDSETNWANMFASFEYMSRDAVKKYLLQVRERVTKERSLNNISQEEFLQKIKAIDGALKDLGRGNNAFANVDNALKKWRDSVDKFGKGSREAKKDFKDLAGTVSNAADEVNSIIGDVASSLEKLGVGGDGLQDTLNSVMGVVGGIGDIGKGIATGNPVDIIKGSVQLLTSAIELFNVKDKKLQKKIEGYQKTLDALSASFKQLERDINNSVGESYYTDSAKAIENLTQQQKKYQAMLDAERGKKKADQGKINEYQNAINDIPNQIADIQKAMSETLVQTSFRDVANNLADAFSEAFKAGEDAAGRFDDVFKQVIQNAVKNSLKLKLIEKPVAAFTDALAAYMKGNNNSVAGFDFDKWKKILKDAGDSMTASLTGFGEFFKTDVAAPAASNDPKTLSNAIKGITADQADLLAGQFGGQRIATLEGNELKKQGNLTGMEQLAVMKQAFLTFLKIEDNTRRSAEVEESYLPYLKDIAGKLNNTSNATRAAGG